MIAKVLVGGEAWPNFNATSESVSFAEADLKSAGFVRKLQDVVVSYRESLHAARCCSGGKDIKGNRPKCAVNAMTCEQGLDRTKHP